MLFSFFFCNIHLPLLLTKVTVERDDQLIIRSAVKKYTVHHRWKRSDITVLINDYYLLLEVNFKFSPNTPHPPTHPTHPLYIQPATHPSIRIHSKQVGVLRPVNRYGYIRANPNTSIHQTIVNLKRKFDQLCCRLTQRWSVFISKYCSYDPTMAYICC